MFQLKNYLLSLTFVFISIWSFGQSAQSEYLEAKRLFKNGQYSSARAAFGAMSQHELFGRHASFFFALSSYHLEDFDRATDMWRQLLVQFPEWEQKSEVLYWLAYTHFETGDIKEGLKYATELTEATLNADQEEELILKFVQPLSTGAVDTLYTLYPEHEVLAQVLLRKLNAAPYDQRDIPKINALMEKWDFDGSELFQVDLPDVRKDTYDIAVVLPFLFESLQNTALITQNRLVMDMYQGMLLAAEDLAAKGMPVTLWPYDTKRTPEATADILATPGFEQHDLIIGPLYPGPNELVNSYSVANQINMINPLSSNTSVIGANPFSFLIRPSYETQAAKMAELAVLENSNPYAMVIYEKNERDSVFAAVYKSQLEAAGKEVVLYQEITRENSRELLDVLWKQYDGYLTQEQADSIMELPRRFVKSRRIRRDELQRMERDTSFVLPISYDEEQNKVVYYEKRFTLAPDSIGHIMAATRSNLFANNLISAVETRGDSTRLYGYGEWLDFTMIALSQLERLGVALGDPDHMDRGRYRYEELQDRLLERYMVKPTVNHFRGYEVVYFTGQMMHRYGKYFQKEIRSGDYYRGQVYEGYRYGHANDNQVVPIVRFKNAKLEVVNREQYEDRKE